MAKIMSMGRAACVLFLISWWAAIYPVAPTHAEPAIGTSLRVTDAIGRSVEIKAPVERVVTINVSSAIILRALGVDLEKQVVGVSTYVRENSGFWPELKDKPAFIFTQLNYERLAELNPQLIILYKNSSLTTDEGKLASLGTQWIYMDCIDPRTIDHDIRILGRLFNKQGEAEELIAWRQKTARMISEHMGVLRPEERPRVYFYTFVYTNLNRRIYTTKNSKSCSHPMVEEAGGINLGEDLPKEYLQVSGEWIIQQNPETIIGGVIGKDVCGYHANEAEARINLRALYREMVSDPVLKETDAVKQGRVLLLAQDLKEGPACVVGTAYMAKFLHPERFKDLHPEEILREYLGKWCHLPLRGVYVYPEIPTERKQTDPNCAKTVTIVDSAGRTLTVPQPLKRIAGLQTSACNAFSLLELEDQVVGVTEYLEVDPGLYPRLKDKPDIGSVYTPHYEIIAEAGPQVVFMGTEAVNLNPAIDQLTPMGVTVAAMDFQPIKGDDAYAREAYYDEELLLLGRIIGKEERARAFIRWKTDILDMIRSRTSQGIEKKRVLGINSISTILNKHHYSIWVGKRIIELAGGLDLSSNITAQEVNGEWILEQDPDVIIVSSYWPEEGLGYRTSDTIRASTVYRKVILDQVISQTRAAKTAGVYLFAYYGLASGGQTAMGALYLAKRLYPSRFSDIDPEAYHRDYLERWFHIPFQGVWFYP